MNLKLKVLAIVAIIFTVVSALYVAIQIKEHDRDIEWAITREEQSFESTVTLFEQHQLDHYINRLKSIVLNKELILALANRERENLFQRTLPFFLELKLENDTHLNLHFHLPDGTSFLRMHSPEKYGDSLINVRPVIQQVHEKKIMSAAYEIGRSGCFFRIAEPVFFENEYVGVVEIGIPVMTFARAIKDQFNITTSLFFEIERWNKVQFKKYSIRAIGKYVVLNLLGNNVSGTPLNAELFQEKHTQVNHDGRAFIVHSLPIFADYQGNIIGGFITYQDITPFVERKKHFVRLTVSMMLILFFAFMGCVYFTLGQLMDKVESYQRKQRELLGSLRHEIAERERFEKERSSLQAQLLQAQKMEALGLLSGGISHDFNNLLTSMMGYTQLILTDANLSDRVKKQLYSITQAGEKAANLIRHLMTFSRIQPVEMEPVNVSAIVQDLRKMIHLLVGADVEVILDFGEEESVIIGDQTQIEQIVMNLAANARDAMPNGGILTIAVEKHIVEKEIQCSFSEVSPGTYVMLSVSDTGYGIDSEDAERIFEPFFTTKSKQQGTGLGLSTVFGIVAQHNGHVCVESEIGKGSVFKIALPAIHRRKADREQLDGIPALLKGDETILVIDDEVLVLDVVKEILVSLGYQVLSAKNSTEAVSVLQKHKDTIQMVLVDIVLPGMNGLELYTQLKELSPGLKVIYMSGHSTEMIEQYGVDGSKMQFLQKPLSMGKVATALRRVLDAD